MAFNKTKFYGPESSFSYYPFITTKSPDDDVKTKNSKQHSFLTTGVVTETKGSAYMEYNNTKIICAVLPPYEPTKNNENSTTVIESEFSFAPFSNKNTSQQNVKKQKSLALILKKAIEPIICRNEFINFKIGIYVLVLEDGDDLLNTTLNCASAALVEAGIPVYDLYASSDTKKVSTSNNCEGNQNNVTVFSSSGTNKQISECVQEGYMEFEDFKAFLNQKNDENIKLISGVLMNNLNSQTSLTKKKACLMLKDNI